MPVYQVDIEKSGLNVQAQTIYWTNVYHVSAADQASAVGLGNSIVTLEKTIHSTSVAYTKMRVRNVSVLGMAPTIVPLSGTGGKSPSADTLPIFCTLRCDFSKTTGRPNRKYLRVMIGELEQTSGVLASAVMTAAMNNYVTPLVNMGTVCDSDGTLITGGAVLAAVQMRQLRRGSKRRVTPVI